MTSLNFKKLSKNAIVPKKGSKYAAGYDLYSTVNTSVEPHTWKLIHTDIAIELPEGYYGMIKPRSGLAFKRGIDTLAGVIDCDYRDGLGVILLNNGNDKFEILEGDRIAQIVFERYYDFEFKEVNELSSSVRKGGFGSTGIRDSLTEEEMDKEIQDLQLYLELTPTSVKDIKYQFPKNI